MYLFENKIKIYNFINFKDIRRYMDGFFLPDYLTDF